MWLADSYRAFSCALVIICSPKYHRLGQVLTAKYCAVDAGSLRPSHTSREDDWITGVGSLIMDRPLRVNYRDTVFMPVPFLRGPVSRKIMGNNIESLTFHTFLLVKALDAFFRFLTVLSQACLFETIIS